MLHSPLHPYMEPERRKAPDGGEYTQEEFIAFFPAGAGAVLWEKAVPISQTLNAFAVLAGTFPVSSGLVCALRRLVCDEYFESGNDPGLSRHVLVGLRVRGRIVYYAAACRECSLRARVRSAMPLRRAKKCTRAGGVRLYFGARACCWVLKDVPKGAGGDGIKCLL